jgi:cleavage stimulation factor subunit 3
LFDLAKSVHWIVDESQYTSEIKRRRLIGNDDSDDEANANAAPANDVYRLRQQKRFNK